MEDFPSYMTRMRRECDQHFADAEAAALRRDWSTCAGHLLAFLGVLEMHFQIEETVLFPALEEETGGEIGSTRVMSLEHLRMRELMQRLSEAAAREDACEYLDRAATLSILMQQHNMKEENFLYPMMDEMLATQREVLQADIADIAEPA